MIELDRIQYCRNDSHPILDRISFKIEDGEYVSIMGPNGAGKTTLAGIIKGLISPTDGTVSVDGVVVNGIKSGSGKFKHTSTVKEQISGIGIVFQDPEDVFVSTTCEREMAFGLENMGIPRIEMVKRVSEGLQRFGLEEYRHTNPLFLSGGEKQKLAIASIMVMQPRHIILDEPTSLLDPSDRRLIMEMIDSLSTRGETIIHITPFLEEASRAKRLIIINDGKVYYDGDPASVLEDTSLMTQYGLQIETEFISGPSIQKNMEMKPCISLKNISYIYREGYPDASRALEDVSLEVIDMACTAVMGPTGSGKSTLLEISAGLLNTVHGSLIFNSLKKETAVGARTEKVLGFVFQFPEAQIFAETVYEEVAFGPVNQGLDEKKVEKRVIDALDITGFESSAFLDRDPHTLSAGEKRCLAIAGILALDPDIIIMDEPTAALDAINTSRLINIIRQLLHNGKTIMFSSHNLEFVRAVAVHVVVLRDGRIESAGLTENTLKTSPWIRECYQS